MIIIHHNDADGRCAAAIVARSPLANKPITFIEADYGKLKDKAWVEAVMQQCNRQTVFIVDFSLELTEMGILDRTCDMHWIDHHASRADFPTSFKGLRNFEHPGMAGCELAWTYCMGDKPMPEIVKLIGDYDKWALTREPECKPLILWLDSTQFEPAHGFWDNYLDTENDWQVADMVAEGQVMQKYRDGYTRGLRESIGFPTEFHGLDCFALNCARMGNAMFGEEFYKRQACLSFFFDGKLFTVSIYSTKAEIDCAAIAKAHGGGGHKAAAGFVCTQLPFQPTKKTV